MSVSPVSATISIGDSTTFHASVTGSANASVTWMVQESGGGTIDSNGNYTAPQARGTYHVIAISAFDNSAASAATVTVQSGGIVGSIN